MRDGLIRSSFPAFKYRDYRLFWSGNVVSFLGDWIDQIALSWFVITTTGDPVMLGAVNLARGVPIMLFTMLGGVLADRISLRTTIICSQALQIVIAIAFAITAAWPNLSIWVVIILAACRGTVVAINLPFRHSLIFNLVPREALGSAIAINSISYNFAKVLGPIVSAAVIYYFSIEVCFIINAATYVFVIFTLLPLNFESTGKKVPKEPFLTGLLTGAGYIKKNKPVLLLIGCALIPTFFCQPYLQLLAVFSAQVFDAGSSGLGMMTAIAAFGSIAGGLLANWHKIDIRRGKIMLSSMGAFGLSVTLFSAAPNFYFALPALFLAGIMHVTYNAANDTMLQLSIDDEYRGRVLSYLLTTRGLVPLGTASMAVMSEILGPRLAVGSMAMVVVVFAALCWKYSEKLLLTGNVETI